MKGKDAWIVVVPLVEIYLANIAAVIGFVGMTTLPGPLFVNWYDSAIGQLYRVDGTARVNDLMTHTMWGPAAFTAPG